MGKVGRTQFNSPYLFYLFSKMIANVFHRIPKATLVCREETGIFNRDRHKRTNNLLNRSKRMVKCNDD